MLKVFINRNIGRHGKGYVVSVSWDPTSVRLFGKMPKAKAFAKKVAKEAADNSQSVVEIITFLK